MPTFVPADLGVVASPASRHLCDASEQRWSYFFCKGSESKHFKLCGPHAVFAVFSSSNTNVKTILSSLVIQSLTRAGSGPWAMVSQPHLGVFFLLFNLSS